MSEAAVEAPQQPSGEAPAPEKTFSQAELDRMISERLARQKAQFGDVDGLKQKAAEFDKLQEERMTEQQKLSARAEAAERAQQQAQAEALRYKAAATHQVSADNFDLLGSGNEEEVTARAQRVGAFEAALRELETVKAELEVLKQGRPGNIRPTESLRPGATPVEVPVAGDAYPSAWLPGPRPTT